MRLVLVIQRTSGFGAASRPLILNAMHFKYHGIFYYWFNHNSDDIRIKRDDKIWAYYIFNDESEKSILIPEKEQLNNKFLTIKF